MLPRLLRLAALALLLFGAAAPADGPVGADEWKYDVLHVKKGPPFRGLLVEETKTHYQIKTILRRPGRVTLIFTHFVPARDVVSVERLDPKERERLRQRLDAVRHERDALANRLERLGRPGKGPALDLVKLRPTAWPPDEKAPALAYSSAHFLLVSNARPEVVQLAAIHLEQVYAAYARALPARARGAPTTILLARSLGDYRAIARERGLNLFNPAFYDPARNQVVCGSDLERLADELEKLRVHHEKLLTGIKDRKARLRVAYRGKVPEGLLSPLLKAEEKIARAEKGNRAAFTAAGARFFERLYHEAFHAYLSTFVYPSKEGPLPRWFDEGLAQIFETAIVEVGELRIGHADTRRLMAARALLTKGELPRLIDLLRSGPKQFLVAHAGDRQVSDRHYLASWSLAFYLTFAFERPPERPGRRGVLGTAHLDEYVAALHRGTDPVVAFRALVGQPLEDFEKDWHAHLRRLRPDGTTAP